MNRFGGEYRFGAWLSRILSNGCADAGARRRAERALPQRLGLEVSTTPDASDTVSDRGARSSRRGETNARRSSAIRTIMMMPPTNSPS
jgi:DNA-directed RNA polymerase specialized sigma24 family protein